VSKPTDDAAALAAQVDVAMAASRVFVSVIAESMGHIDSTVSPLQLRTLVIVHSTGPLNVNSLAEMLSVHPSNATRVCDRLVRSGLLARTQSELDRRHLELTLTADGTKLVKAMMDRRRAALTRVLARMNATNRTKFTEALQAFGEAAGEHAEAARSQYGTSLTIP
jgi:DNA-binding MarR family transcriptional regulator